MKNTSWRHRLLVILAALLPILSFSSGALASPAPHLSSNPYSSYHNTINAHAAAAQVVNAGSVTLNGSNQTYSFQFPFTVTYSPLDGWNVTFSTTQFSTGGATPSLLATNAATIQTVPTAACTAGFICVLPINSVTYPVMIPAATTPPPGVKVYNAAIATGSGKVTVTTTITLAIPFNATPGNYTSTVYLDLYSGP